jgi:hypothetical protein
MKAYGGVGIWTHIFFTSALFGGECSASRPGRLTPEESDPCTHWIGGWVGPRTGLEDVEKRKFFTLQGLELQPLSLTARSQSLYRLRYPGSSTRAVLPQIPHESIFGRSRMWLHIEIFLQRRLGSSTPYKISNGEICSGVGFYPSNQFPLQVIIISMVEQDDSSNNVCGFNVGDSLVRSSAKAVWTEIYCVFPIYSGVNLKLSHGPFLKKFPIYYSLIIRQFDAI